MRARDRRFDGRFFVAVSSTKIYCRPICPVRPPKRENMHFYSSAAAAEGAGYRPCLRCRPERAPGAGAVDAVSRLVSAAIAGMEEHALASSGLAELAASLGVSDRHLRRVTEAELGVSPIELAQTQRLLLAKRLLSETSLQLTEIAFASGFGSVRRFNALFKSRYGLSPRSLRTAGRSLRGPGNDGGALSCQLDFRPPLAWDSLLAYLRLRAIPGVEAVDAAHYRRTVAIDGHTGWIAVSLAKNGMALRVDISHSLAPAVGAVIARVKQLCDLGAAPDAVSAVLSQDSVLRPVVRRLPGLRVPGAFDGFELGVRAILGQQVSVRAATTMAGRWAHAFGTEIVTPYPDLNRLTPSARQLTDVSADAIASLGIVRSRARCIAALVRAVNERRVVLTCAVDVETQIDALMQLPGIGPWTAQYIAMRALHWPDAFPGTDLMLLRAANAGRKELHARAEAWRPWRAYATHYLWQSLGVFP
ncbi:MAG: helix-turn-helix domain-containing protein [Pseudomonadota bacterium]|nr:helix-turn-helix domain-containing protein [Pseudomonadota bacterium]